MADLGVSDTGAGHEAGSDELQPGTQLSNGTYTIIQHLKTGGFGITYLATDTLGRKVVIKECFPGGMCSRASLALRVRSRAHASNVSDLIEKFVAEAHSLAKVGHPNVVNVHQVFRENDTAYMAMDYVEGHDLLEVTADPALAFTASGVKSTLLKLLDAIATIHDRGLLHRDISPDNILIDSKRNPVLIDFGAAREQDREAASPASTLHVVKDGYSPQELYLSGGTDQGPWSDLYSLAASFYHVIGRKAPENSQIRLAAMASGQPDPCPPLAGRIDGYEPAFLAAIDKAMSVLPKERIQTARQWIAMIGGEEGAKVVRLPLPENTRQVTPMTRVTRMEAEAGRKKIGPFVFVGGAAALAVVATGVFLAMPDSNTAAVARLPADVAAARVSSDAPAPAAPAPAAPAVETPAVETAAAPEAPAAAAPAVAPAPEPMPEISSVTALTANWTVDLPFAANEAEPNRVLRISGTVPDWLRPGVQVVAVNGAPVSRIDEIPELVRQAVDPGRAGSVPVTLSVIAEGETAAVDRPLELTVLRRLLLANGAQFLVRPVGEQWQTEVVALPQGYSGELRIGDIVTGHVTTGTRIDTATALQEALEASIISGEGSTKLAVQQGGQMWVVTFPLPR